ncbi:unnamed protein product [Phytophthora fragariaefolia]|uniref:Unnamed protein product n=1 Tax=Phytophthora fragariaefolia TaxID=1490495 RepID=A0A9W7DAK0_9STRA|nr:unnamed protein product [Phytophthora fragariaefolia]
MVPQDRAAEPAAQMAIESSQIHSSVNIVDLADKMAHRDVQVGEVVDDAGTAEGRASVGARGVFTIRLAAVAVAGGELVCGQNLRRHGAVDPVEALVHHDAGELRVGASLEKREVVQPVGDVHAASEGDHERVVEPRVAHETLEVVPRVLHHGDALQRWHERARLAVPVDDVLLLAVGHGRHVRQVHGRGLVVAAAAAAAGRQLVGGEGRQPHGGDGNHGQRLQQQQRPQHALPGPHARGEGVRHSPPLEASASTVHAITLPFNPGKITGYCVEQQEFMVEVGIAAIEQS